MAKTYLDQLLKFEEEAAKGQSSSLNDSYDQRVYKGDYKMAESLTWLVGEEWEEVRTLIARGQFMKAKELLSTLGSEDQLGQQEAQFEEARTALFEGEFEKTLDITTSLLKDKQLNPLTHMTSLQLQSVALLETGQTKEALDATEKILVLENIFPKAQASLYGRVARCRALNELGNIYQADHEGKELWDKISSGVYNLNLPLQLIMYCRMMCKIAIQRKLPFAGYAMAGFWLGKEIESPLHQGFFLLDLSISEDPELRKFATAELKSYKERFSCLRRFAQGIASYESLNMATGIDKYTSTEPDSLLFLKENYVYSLEKNELKKLDLHQKTLSILKFMKNLQVEKENLFKSVWEVNSFNPIHNDSSIRTALKRLREDTEVTVTSHNMLIEIPTALIVL